MYDLFFPPAVDISGYARSTDSHRKPYIEMDHFRHCIYQLHLGGRLSKLETLEVRCFVEILKKSHGP